MAFVRALTLLTRDLGSNHIEKNALRSESVSLQVKAVKSVNFS